VTILREMKIAIGRLRELFAEAMKEAKVGASASYLSKEKVREQFQKNIVELVKSKQVQSQEELESFFQDADMALKALKMVPIAVWMKMAGQGGTKT
jgi:hypothetical protein